MRIVVAPDSFKGSLTSNQICAIIKDEIMTEIPNAIVETVPMADGGEGTCKALVHATQGKLIDVTVLDPLGNTIKTYYGVLGDGKTAVIEMATIAGYTMIPQGKRDIMKLTTYGVGQCIRHALDNGYRNIIIGIGGSATNDGGIGMLQALGITFYDKKGQKLPENMESLFYVDKVDYSTIDPRIYETNIRVASDVENPLCGPNGTSAIFGNQKGATTEQIAFLDQKLFKYAEIVEKHIHKQLKDLKGAGAAGGIGFALLSLNGKMEFGASIVSDIVKLEQKIKDADLVITGEGKTDEQTLLGKLPYYVASIAKQYNVKSIIISGEINYNLPELHDVFYSMHSISSGPMSLQEAMNQTEELLRITVKNVARLITL